MNAIVRMLAVYAGLSLLLCGFTHLEWSPLAAQRLRPVVRAVPADLPGRPPLAEFLGERLLGRRAAGRFRGKQEPQRLLVEPHRR